MIEVPDSYKDDTELMGYVRDIELRAIGCWKYAAANVLWRTWIEHKLEPSDVFGADFNDRPYYEIRNGYIEGAAEVVDPEALWQRIGGFSLSEDIASWKDQPGMYGFVLTKEKLDSFEEVAKAMFPSYAGLPCAAETAIVDFPDDPDPASLTDWASALMEQNGVTEAYKALRARVPLEDIIAARL